MGIKDFPHVFGACGRSSNSCCFSREKDENHSLSMHKHDQILRCECKLFSCLKGRSIVLIVLCIFMVCLCFVRLKDIHRRGQDYILNQRVASEYSLAEYLASTAKIFEVDSGFKILKTDKIELMAAQRAPIDKSSKHTVFEKLWNYAFGSHIQLSNVSDASVLDNGLGYIPQAPNMGPMVTETIAANDCDASELTTSMIFVSSNLLWCPAAKVGTSTIYKSLAKLLLNQSESDTMTRQSRCYRGFHCGNEFSNEDSASCSAKEQWSCDIETKPLVWARNDKTEICQEARKRLSFTTIRNPWDRILSVYNGKIKTKTLGSYKVKGRWFKFPKHKIISFADFVRLIAKQKPEEMDTHWQPYYFRCHTSGKHRFEYDTIIRYEDEFEQKLQQLYHEAGFRYLPDVEVYSNTKNDLNERYNAYTNKIKLGISHSMELVNLVAKVYAEDIIRFNYSFYT
uniref:Carbohydrate sulfotransferase n=1 Tax=Aplanochytrium stocchinoi TaxID=215587 RepID=A0A7S3LL91_9STRA|mmetsp:Transcript_16031/g.19054  ORF Transcript_16031/g.19054 Transcript_16031/m.19054 type:complete len:454 (+) Transcript_16031:258-1619(+)